jgi:lincosamide nucleotidyltransferase A/C/D/E
VLDVLQGLRFWIDGGWGVDALVGRQTREHDDLDAAIDRADLAEAVRQLEALGFAHRPEIEPGLPARFVLCDDRCRQIDLHPLTFDGNGDGWQELPDAGRGLYPGRELDARGTIAGRAVPCISARLQLRHHDGYEPTQRDLDDMLALAERFSLELPESIQALL